jgi:dTDP-4-dehydrorhamnose reductase
LNSETGIFNYSNAGIITWYDFAVEISNFIGSNCIVNAIPTSLYPTPAKRPQYSVLDTSKIKRAFDIQIPDWKVSLHNCLAILS